jgi:hypothetical protein
MNEIISNTPVILSKSSLTNAEHNFQKYPDVDQELQRFWKVARRPSEVLSLDGLQLFSLTTVLPLTLNMCHSLTAWFSPTQAL